MRNPHRFPRANALMKLRITALLILGLSITAVIAAQSRRRQRVPRPATATQAPRSQAVKYSAFLHSSEKHKSLACKDCHRIPTAWTAQRDFPDVADFPDHDACVRCHRPQFFTRRAMIGTGPAICTVCHVRAAPREDRRFAFGRPNNANQPIKPRGERQFAIEFPHDKHQNVIAANRGGEELYNAARRSHHRLKSAAQREQKADYNNCSICHRPDMSLAILALPPPATDPALLHPFKTVPRSHEACFSCHWKQQQPEKDDCAGCHKPTDTFVPLLEPKRVSAKFAHEGGKGEHVLECTSCHINITRAASLRALTPDVPINACASCHRDSKKTTYPKATTIEAELEQLKKTNECTYCHDPKVGKKRPPPSHEAAVQ